MRPLDTFLARFPDARRSGSEWSARCPAHEDRTPSLTFCEGTDGRVLVHCHAGCTTEAVCRAKGLRLTDIMPEREADDRTAEVVARFLEKRFGRRAAEWHYTDGSGRHVGTILRWNTPDGGKQIFPVSLVDGVWQAKGMPCPRPLYRLPECEAADSVYVTEGEKAAEAVRRLGYVATTSAHGSKSAKQTDWSPLAGKSVVILPDNDDPGREYAGEVARLLRQVQPPPVVKIVEVPDLPVGGDVADVPMETEADRETARELLRALTESAAPCDDRTIAGLPTRGTSDLYGNDVAASESVSEKPVVWVEAGEKARATDQSLAIVAGEFFQRGGQLVRCISTPRGSHIVPVTKEGVDDVLNRRIEFRRTKTVRGGKFVEMVCDSPEWLAKNIACLQKWPMIRPLEAIHRGPFIRKDGTVGGLNTGYDQQSRCWVETDEDWQELAEPVTDEQVAESIASLRSIVDEFPFRTEAGFSVWLAAILSRLGRPAIDGPCPLFVISAPTPGSGKSLLAKLAAIIADGVPPGMLTLSPANDEENRKLFTSALQDGAGVLVFDNVVGQLKSPALDRLLTSTEWSDRILGHTQLLKLENHAICIMTSNNTAVAADTCRRSLALVLSPLQEKPEEREFKIPNIQAYVTKHRRQLIIAAMRILLRHLQKGKPRYRHWRDASSNDRIYPVRAFGSFEAWSDVVRHAIIGAGLPDPVMTTSELYGGDEDGYVRRRFVEAWRDWRPDWRGTAKEMLAVLFAADRDQSTQVMADAMDEFVRDVSKKDGLPTASDLGYALRSIRERTYSNLRIEPCGDCRFGTVWGLRSVGEPLLCGDDQVRVEMPSASSSRAPEQENTGFSSPL